MGLVCEYDSTLINIPNQFLGEIIHYWYRLFTFTIELLKLRAKKKTYGWGTSTLSFHSIDCTSTYKFTGRWWRGAPSRLFVFRVFQRDCLACRRAGQSAIRASSNSSRTPSPHSVETAVLRTLAERCEARLMSGCAPIFSTVLDRSQRYQRPYWEQEYGSGLLCFAIIHGRVVRDPSFLLYRTIVQNAAVLETLF